MDTTNSDELKKKVQRLQEHLLRVALKHGIDSETAADLVQELWVFVLERAQELRRTASTRQRIRPIGILIGKILNQRRFNKRHPSCAGSEGDEESLQAEDMDLLGFTSSRFSDPEEAVFQKEKLEQLFLAISKLPPSQQKAILSCYYENLTIRELAQVSSDSRSGAGRNLQAALLRLREELAPLAPEGQLSSQDPDSEEE